MLFADFLFHIHQKIHIHQKMLKNLYSTKIRTIFVV
ncbi:TPA_asm: hypothetical protein [Porphyromonas phage phage024a_F0570]|uniref:Uncharacterized protein n=1 Tax=Porphyromonas phage phage024a_F0570 TaxID=3154114 RepID=A0AAT9J8Z9_9CAUD